MRGHVRRGLLVVLAAVIALVGVPSTAVGVIGGVSGTVTESGTGTAISGATVDLWSLDGELAATTTTDASGHYSFEASALVSGVSYSVAVTAEGYSYAESAVFRYAGTAVTRDVQLSLLVLIATGTVTDAITGLPVPGAIVDAWVWESGDYSFPVGCATTDANGTYAIYDEYEMLQSGDYIAFDVYGDGYAPFSASSTNGVTYTGSPFTFDVELAPAPLIASGTVTDADTGLPIADAEVDAWVWENGDYSGYVGHGLTDEAGYYEIHDSSGMLQVGDCVVFEVYVGGYDPFIGSGANGVNYTGSPFLFDVELLAAGPVLSGQVIEYPLEIPVPGAEVDAWVWGSDDYAYPVGSAVADAEGNYQICDEWGLLQSGDQIVFDITADGYGTREHVSPVTYSGSPLALDLLLARLLGTVTVVDAVSRLPIPNADVSVYSWDFGEPQHLGDSSPYYSGHSGNPYQVVYQMAVPLNPGDRLSFGVRADGYAPLEINRSTAFFYSGVPVTQEVELYAIAQTTLEDRAADVTFDRFVPSTSSAYSGGSYVYGRWTGTMIEARFTGSQIKWIGPKQPNYGRAEVYIDNAYVTTVDCYSPASSATLSTVIFNSGVITYGEHTISIRLTGAKNGASTGSVVVLDNFQVTTSSGVTPCARVNENAGVSSGAWVNCGNTTYTSGTYRYSYWPRAMISYSFTGTKIAWIGPRAFNYGQAEVYIDGQIKATVSQYGALGWRHHVWESETLARGTHTIEILVLGTKEPASSGRIVVVDGFDVTP